MLATSIIVNNFMVLVKCNNNKLNGLIVESFGKRVHIVFGKYILQYVAITLFVKFPIGDKSRQIAEKIGVSMQCEMIKTPAWP